METGAIVALVVLLALIHGALIKALSSVGIDRKKERNSNDLA